VQGKEGGAADASRGSKGTRGGTTRSQKPAGGKPGRGRQITARWEGRAEGGGAGGGGGGRGKAQRGSIKWVGRRGGGGEWQGRRRMRRVAPRSGSEQRECSWGRRWWRRRGCGEGDRRPGMDAQLGKTNVGCGNGVVGKEPGKEGGAPCKETSVRLGPSNAGRMEQGQRGPGRGRVCQERERGRVCVGGESRQWSPVKRGRE